MNNTNNNNDDLKSEVNTLIQDLEEPESNQEVEQIRNEDPMVGMRNSLINFIENRLKVVDSEEHFRSVVKNAIETKIYNDEVSMSQLINLLKTVDSDTTNAAESILSLLRPNQSGEVSPLFNGGRGAAAPGSEEAAIPSEFDNLDPQQAEVLNKLSRLVQHMEDSENNTSKS